MKTYNYFIENLDTEKIEETKEKIANLPLVKEVNITEGENNLALSYTLGDNDDEYDVFVAVADTLQKQGADIAFEDSKPKVVEEAERQEDNQEDSQDCRKFLLKQSSFSFQQAYMLPVMGSICVTPPT